MGRLIVAAATDGLQGGAARADTDVVSSATVPSRIKRVVD